MPRVSADHLERRRHQILSAARNCFARKGFHATSMQDIFAESGLSAGAVYRYFKSKNELIEAIVQDMVGHIVDLVSDMVHDDPLPDLGELAGRTAQALCNLKNGDGARLRIAPQAWALALNDPQIAKHVHRSLLRIRELWRIYAERMRDTGHLPVDSDIDAIAGTLFGLLPGFILQCLLLDDGFPHPSHGTVTALDPAAERGRRVRHDNLGP